MFISSENLAEMPELLSVEDTKRKNLEVSLVDNGVNKPSIVLSGSLLTLSGSLN